MNPENLPEHAQALRRSLGDCPVVTPDALCTFAAWLLATLKSELTTLQTTDGGGVQWARSGQLAARFGCRRSQMSLWLATLRERRLVRVWQPQLPDGATGNPYYNIADVERAWLVAAADTATASADDPIPARPGVDRRRIARPGLPPQQQAGLAAMQALTERCRAERLSTTA